MSVPPARPEAMRRHNLGLVLREIHRDGALTRAELTARLGMSRSTIGALVTDLTELELLHESVPNGGTRAGRPSYMVGPHDGGPYVVAVDVDVTQVTTAAVGIGGTVLAREIIAITDPPPSPEDVAKLIVDVLPRLRERIEHHGGPESIGISVPGTVDRDSGLVKVAPNLEWHDAPLGAVLSTLLDPAVPVVVGNDADLAVLAEHNRGIARDCADVVYLIGRIGVGAGIIADGAQLRGRDGHAGEIGHNVVDAAGPACHCGKRGCLETYVGASALLGAAGRHGPATGLRVSSVIADAYAGDLVAMDAVRTVARALGRGLAGVVNMLNPEQVILGGTLTDVLALARADLEHSLEQYALEPPYETVRLVAPRFGEDSALLGAAEIAFAGLLDNPGRR